MSGGQAANTKTTNKPARRPGSRRRLLAWTLLTTAAIVAGLWVVSVWWWSRIGLGKWSACISNGTLSLLWMDGGDSLTRVTFERASQGPCWWLRRPVGLWKLDEFASLGIVYVTRVSRSGSVMIVEVVILLWPIALLTALSGTGLLISARRARRRALTKQKCPACGYDLIGLPPNAPCPECGPKVA